MHPRPLPPLLRGQPFRVADAVPEVGRERLRRGDLAAPAHGLRVPRGHGAGALTSETLTSEALTSEAPALELLTPEVLSVVLGPHQFFSHDTAARLWGLPVPPSTTVHVTTVGRGGVMCRPGVVGHRILPSRASLDMVRGLPVSDRVSAWAECATLVDLDDLIRLGDALLAEPWKHDLADLEAAVDRRRGSRGVGLLREALPWIRPGVESPKETDLRLLIVRDGIEEPEINVETYDERGRFVGRPDLRFARAKVTVEYDGDHHRDDKRRREAFNAAGWHAIHVSDDDLTTFAPEFLARLRAALARRTPDPG